MQALRLLPERGDSQEALADAAGQPAVAVCVDQPAAAAHVAETPSLVPGLAGGIEPALERSSAAEPAAARIAAPSLAGVFPAEGAFDERPLGAEQQAEPEAPHPARLAEKNYCAHVVPAERGQDSGDSQS